MLNKAVISGENESESQSISNMLLGLFLAFVFLLIGFIMGFACGAWSEARHGSHNHFTALTPSTSDVQSSAAVLGSMLLVSGCPGRAAGIAAMLFVNRASHQRDTAHLASSSNCAAGFSDFPAAPFSVEADARVRVSR